MALLVHFMIFKRLREREVSDCLAVEDVTHELSKVELIVDSGEEPVAKVPKRAWKIVALFPEPLHRLDSSS